jgi:NTE family protein
LAGGNALGAFEAGALSVLAGADCRPALAAGTSIGAVNAALFLAPRDGDPDKTLRRFWEASAQTFFAPSRKQESHWAALSSILFGRPTISRNCLSALWPGSACSSLHNTEPLRQTLLDLVDFAKLPPKGTRLWIGTTILDPDQPHFFDSAETSIEVDHILASAALPVLFPPIKVVGRYHVDGGMFVNLPLEPIVQHISAEPAQEMTCIALDLYPLDRVPPRSVDEAGERFQNLFFGLQSRRSLAVAHEQGLRVLHLPYVPALRETAGKAFDFSRNAINRRWQAGSGDATAWSWFRSTALEIGKTGSAIIQPAGSHRSTAWDRPGLE